MVLKIATFLFLVSQDKLVEIAYLNENIAGTAMASSYGGQATPSGNFLPDVMTLGGDGDPTDDPTGTQGTWWKSRVGAEIPGLVNVRKKQWKTMGKWWFIWKITMFNRQNRQINYFDRAMASSSRSVTVISRGYVTQLRDLVNWWAKTLVQRSRSDAFGRGFMGMKQLNTVGFQQVAVQLRQQIGPRWIWQFLSCWRVVIPSHSVATCTRKTGMVGWYGMVIKIHHQNQWMVYGMDGTWDQWIVIALWMVYGYRCYRKESHRDG